MFGNRRLERKIDAVNYKLDLIMKQLGVEVPAGAAYEVRKPVAAPIGMAEVDALLAQGKKIHAIKVYRELTGVGLKEAKDAVESRERY
ncbi:ribosomal protein L7/L12 [Nocardia sp. NPDC052566]|uniref:ribosomal protein L7/L12 n=1 Tax=Nocardia sp. NPDC052566 TaxID=3364330 RepID=UPI0037C5A8F7